MEDLYRACPNVKVMIGDVEMDQHCERIRVRKRMSKTQSTQFGNAIVR